MATTIGGASPAVTLDEAQAYVRVETGEEEAILAGLIRTATALCEAFIGQALIARPFTEELAAGPLWQRLTAVPVRGIEGVDAIAADGAVSPLAAGDFAIDVDSEANGWVRAMLVPPGSRIRVRGTVGLAADASDVPEPIRQGILRLVAHLYAARDWDGGAPPAAVTALWRPYRRMRLS